MNLRKLNEQIEKLLEISDETKKSYLDKRQAQADKAQKNLEKAKKSIAKSDKRQISNLPQQTTLENAKAALNALKSEMRKVSSGSDWSLGEEDHGKYLNLSVRYWGEWNDKDEDDDWASLDDKYEQILNDILVKVQTEYQVKIINQGGEKKWLSFDILLKNKKTLPYEWQIRISDLDSEYPVELFYYVPDPIDEGAGLTLEKDGTIHLDSFEKYRSYFEMPDMDEVYDFIAWSNPTKDPDDIPEIPRNLLDQFRYYKNLIDSRNKLKDESLNITEAGKDYRLRQKRVNTSKLIEEIESLLEEGKDYQHARELGYSDAQDFKVGDKVRRIWDKRPGIITKQIAVDTYEVEFPEYGTNMARTDRYYANDLQLLDSDFYESKEENGQYELKIIVDRNRGSNGRAITTNIDANNDAEALLKVFTNFDLQNSGYFNGDYAEDELDEQELENKNKVLAASNSGENQEEAIQILNDFYFDNLDISDYYDNIIYLKSPNGNIIIEDDLDLDSWFEDDEEYDEEYDDEDWD